jgi:hypothetical protein
MNASGMIASTVLLAGFAAQSATADTRTVGVLICNVEAPALASEQGTSADSAQFSGQSRNMRCILRNQHTGTSNVYFGTLLLAKRINAPSLDPTLLWNVVVDHPTTSKTLLDQTFSVDTDSAKRPYVVVTGDNQPSVELRLEKSKDAPLKSGVLGLKLKLERAAT